MQTGYKERKEVPVFVKWLTEGPVEHHLDHTTGSFCKLKKKSIIILQQFHSNEYLVLEREGEDRLDTVNTGMVNLSNGLSDWKHVLGMSS